MKLIFNFAKKINRTVKNERTCTLLLVIINVSYYIDSYCKISHKMKKI